MSTNAVLAPVKQSTCQRCRALKPSFGVKSRNAFLRERFIIAMS